MTARLSWLFIISSLLLLGCGDEAIEPESKVYDDPTSAYGPPNYRQSKADDARLGPKIKKVTWRVTGACSVESISAVEILVDVESGTHTVDELIFDGTATGCNGTVSDYGPMIASQNSTITCHNVSEHEGMITVVDPRGHGDSIFFRFDSCQSGHVSVALDESP